MSAAINHRSKNNHQSHEHTSLEHAFASDSYTHNKNFSGVLPRGGGGGGGVKTCSFAIAATGFQKQVQKTQLMFCVVGRENMHDRCFAKWGVKTCTHATAATQFQKQVQKTQQMFCLVGHENMLICDCSNRISETCPAKLTSEHIALAHCVASQQTLIPPTTLPSVMFLRSTRAVLVSN